jgi:hypothetical protein
MDEMSGDEMFAMFVSVVLAAGTALAWYLPLLRVTPLAAPLRHRFLLAIAPPLCLALLVPVLHHWAAADVRAHDEYVVLFVFVAAATLGIVAVAMPLLGLSVRDDAVERSNGAAAVAACGALLAVTLCCAGSNVGEGPTIWETIVPGVAAVAALLAAWAVYATASGAMGAITIDRDVASAVRLAGLLVAVGLILGRAVAGDYHSVDETGASFVQVGAPAVFWVAAAVIVHRRFRPTPQRPAPSIEPYGLAPAAAYVLAAVVYVFACGWPK